MKFTTKLLALVLALAMCLSLGATAFAADAAPVPGGTIVIGAGGDPQSFNPDYRGDDNLWPIAQNMFNRLVKLANGDGVLLDLAESYEFNDAGDVLTFHLHDGVKWHDGEPLTSEDVKWTYDTMLAEQWAFASNISAIDTIECPDDLTVVMNLKAPDVTIIPKLAWYGTFILPKHLYEGQDAATCDAALTNPVGSGPFKFDSYESGVSVTLTKNEDYWGDEPVADKLIFAIYTDEDAGYQAFLNGEVDYCYSVPTANTDDLDNDPDYRVFQSIWQNRTYITFNFEDPDFSKKEVRQAMQLAVDRPGIFARVGGAGQMAEYYVSPLQTDFCDKQYKMPDRDVEAAMALLEQAGYTKGDDGFYLHTTMDVFESGNFGDIAQIVKANLAEAGIDMTINMMEMAAWQDKVQVNMDFSVTMLAGYQGPDVSGLVGRIQTGGATNIGGYSNARVDELFELSNCEPDTAKRAEYYSEIQSIMADEVPMILLIDNGGKYPIKNTLVGTPYDLPDKAASSEMTYAGFTE